jgi:hypothetical protein
MSLRASFPASGSCAESPSHYRLPVFISCSSAIPCCNALHGRWQKQGRIKLSIGQDFPMRQFFSDMLALGGLDHLAQFRNTFWGFDSVRKVRTIILASIAVRSPRRRKDDPQCRNGEFLKSIPDFHIVPTMMASKDFSEDGKRPSLTRKSKTHFLIVQKRFEHSTMQAHRRSAKRIAKPTMLSG